MVERIEIILKEFNLSPARFSERLGIQRSGLSHILSGRNKPSFDFFEKLAVEFPEININWLITGSGSMFNREITKEPDLFNPPPFEKVTSDFQHDTQITVNSTKDQELEMKAVSKNETGMEDEVYNGKQLGTMEDAEVEQVIIFYKKGRFKRYLEE